MPRAVDPALCRLLQRSLLLFRLIGGAAWFRRSGLLFGRFVSGIRLGRFWLN
jgi:hypothetical protein